MQREVSWKFLAVILLNQWAVSFSLLFWRGVDCLGALDEYAEDCESKDEY